MGAPTKTSTGAALSNDDLETSGLRLNLQRPLAPPNSLAQPKTAQVTSRPPLGERAASIGYLPSLAEPPKADDRPRSSRSFQRTNSDDVLMNVGQGRASFTVDNNAREVAIESSRKNSVGRRLSLASYPKITISGFSGSSKEDSVDTSYQSKSRPKSMAATPVEPNNRRLSQPGFFSRKSWIPSPSTSRTPSPSRKDSDDSHDSHDDASTAPSSVKSTGSDIGRTASSSTLTKMVSNELKRSSTLKKQAKTKKPLGSLLRPAPSTESVPSLPIPDNPRSQSEEKLHHEIAHMKDVFWGAFRDLDSAYHKYVTP
jgi:hypothetical protein